MDREAETAAHEAAQAARGMPVYISPPGSPWAHDATPTVDERRGLIAATPAALGPLDDSEPEHRVFRPLTALARDVDFTVFRPRGEEYLGYLHSGEDGRPGEDGPAVDAHLPGGRPPGQLLWFRQSRGAKMADPAEWETVELPDGTPASWWSPDSDPEQGHLRFERAGTQIWIQGRGREEIHALAARLDPITLAGDGDEDLVLDLLAEASAWLRGRGIVQWPARFPADSVRRQIADREALLVYAHDQAVATCVVGEGEPHLWGPTAEPAYYVSRLAVARSVAGAGLGHRILQ